MSGRSERSTQADSILKVLEKNFKVEGPINIIETGASHKWDDGMMGLLFARICKETGGRMWMVDIDESIIEHAKQVFGNEGIDCDIVVSSDWKLHATLEELGDYYESQGIIKRPIAVTPNIQNCTVHGNLFIWSPRWDLEQTRTIEIRQYLHDHPEVTHWVSVDDLHMGKIGEPWKDEWAIDNFVLTPRSSEGIKQCGIKEKILNYLQ